MNVSFHTPPISVPPAGAGAAPSVPVSAGSKPPSDVSFSEAAAGLGEIDAADDVPESALKRDDDLGRLFDGAWNLQPPPPPFAGLM